MKKKTSLRTPIPFVSCLNYTSASDLYTTNQGRWYLSWFNQHTVVNSYLLALWNPYCFQFESPMIIKRNNPLPTKQHTSTLTGFNAICRHPHDVITISITTRIIVFLIPICMRCTTHFVRCEISPHEY